MPAACGLTATYAYIPSGICHTSPTPTQEKQAMNRLVPRELEPSCHGDALHRDMAPGRRCRRPGLGRWCTTINREVIRHDLRSKDLAQEL